MAFILPDLDFEYNALEPYIDAKTMEIHHTKHHITYLEKFNAAISDCKLEKRTPSSIFAEISKHSNAIRNNGGGFFNHALFWQCLTPFSPKKPKGKLAESINTFFGSFDKFKEEFSRKAATRLGSGWAWLVLKNNGELVVTSSPNQDNPLMDISPISGIPILCIDVWEHAYYLHYQNNRAAYIKAFWELVNWDFVAQQFVKHSA